MDKVATCRQTGSVGPTPGQDKAVAGTWQAGRLVCWVALLPALVFALLHSRSLDYPFIWTDISAIEQQSMIRPAGEILASFSEPLHRIEFRGANATQSYYRPLQVVLLSLTTQWLDDTPRAYRTLTIFTGALCVAAWGLLALNLTGGIWTASFAAMFVATHPVAIESTTWISGVSGALCALFSIVAISLGLRSASTTGSIRVVGFALASIVALIAALLSKERAAIEPVLLAACLIASRYAATHKIGTRRAIAIASAHIVVSVVYLTLWRAAIVGGIPPIPPIGGDYATQLATSIANWPSALGWTFFPIHSTTSDVLSIVRSLADLRVWAGAALAAGSAVAALAMLRRRPISALGIVWIWIAFAPTAGLFPNLHATGERYVYLSCFGTALLLADGVPALIARTVPQLRRILLIGMAVACILGLAQRTWIRLPDWQSTARLFGTAVERDPEYREGHYLLALDEFERGLFSAAAKRLLPLLEPAVHSPGPQGSVRETTSYLNPLSTFELACANRLAMQDYAGVIALDRIASRQHHPTRGVATFRTCVGQAMNALGDTESAQKIYLSVAAELGASAPPRLALMITRNWIKLGRASEARHSLRSARDAVARAPHLEAQLTRLTARLNALEAASAGALTPNDARP
jgi:hypothetical protein